MKLTDYPVVNGTPLTTPEKNLLAKLDLLGVTVNPAETSAVNPCMGNTVENLHPLVARLSTLVHEIYATYGESGKMNYHGKPVAIGTFDRVKYLVLRLDSRAYSELLD